MKKYLMLFQLKIYGLMLLNICISKLNPEDIFYLFCNKKENNMKNYKRNQKSVKYQIFLERKTKSKANKGC